VRLAAATALLATATALLATATLATATLAATAAAARTATLFASAAPPAAFFSGTSRGSWRALVGLADRAAGASCDADAERSRADPEESALALLDRRDHGLGAAQPQRLESLPYRLIERLAFVH
jgi:hypothetical protein